MKAILVAQPGGPEQLQLRDVPVPTPGPGQLLVKIAASGVNFIDIYHRTGLYKSDWPANLGMEGAGVVESVGDGVTNFKPGSRVAYAMARGSYAEYQLVPAALAVPVPDTLDLQIAAAAMLQGMTAHYLTHSTYPIQAGQTVLVHAAAGGTGLLIVQMAKLLGATVIGTTSNPEKAELARRAGADHILAYADFDNEARRLTNGKGVDAVYDSVGANTFERSLNALRTRGMLASFGQSSGPVKAIEPLLLAQKGSLYLTRPNLAHYIADRAELEWRARDVLSWIADAKLTVQIARSYSLDDAAQAHRDLESRATSGKLILVV
jgi:NADPH2:quinone reductase